MENILLAVGVVGGIGLIMAVLLALASHFLAVKEDEKFLQLRECLLGVNCGACGYAGCNEYAKALAEGGVKTNLCVPGADATAAKLAEILGVEAEDVVEMSAVVRCNGNCNVTSKAFNYEGVNTCQAASMVYGGPNECNYGCLGFGDCANVCPVNAICVEDGIAHVNPKICVGCGLCAETCPKKIIELVPQVSSVAVLCSSKDKGAVARKKCENACIACKKCEKVCPHGAISVKDNLSSIDYDKCTGCGACVEVCPTKCIKRVGLNVG